jgi:hypothetical protein
MDDQTKAEVDRIRSIARAIKACPREAEFPDTGHGTIYDGPPSNVRWDVKPSGSIRAPYFGYIEFFLMREFKASEKTCGNTEYCAQMMANTKCAGSA